MSGYTPAGNFAPTVEGPTGPAGPTGPTGPAGDDLPEGLAVALDFEREELLALDDAFLTARLDEWYQTAGAAVSPLRTEEGRGVYDLTLSGTVGGNWIRADAQNCVGGPRSFEVVAGPNYAGWICLETIGTGGAYLRSWYHLSTGTLGSTAGGAAIIDRQIQRVEGSMVRPFWRCRLTVDDVLGGVGCRVFSCDGDGSIVGLVHAGDPSIVFLAQYQNDPTYPERFGPATRLMQRRIERADCVGWRRFVHGWQGDPTRQPFYFNRATCEWGGYGYGTGGTNRADVGAFFGGASDNVDGSRWLELVGAAGVSELVRRYSDLGLPWAAYLVGRPLNLATAAARPVFALLADAGAGTARAEMCWFQLDRFHDRAAGCNVTATTDRQVFLAQYQGQDTRLNRYPALGGPAVDADLLTTLEPQPGVALERATIGGTPTGTDHPAIASDATLWGFYFGINQHTAAPLAWVAARHGVTP